LIDPDGQKDKPFNPKTDRPFIIDRKSATPAFRKDKKTGEPLLPNPDAYNCHSYAFHDSKGDPTDPGNSRVSKDYPKWDESPSDDLGGYKQLGADEPNKSGDRVLYYVDTNNDGQYNDGEPIPHSAIVREVDKEGNTTVVEAKNGYDGMSKNHPNAPGYYQQTHDGETRRAYFRQGAVKKKDKEEERE
jgi:hypothetical protein